MRDDPGLGFGVFVSTAKRQMSNTILVGAQWGDEGKGKIIDFLTEQADMESADTLSFSEFLEQYLRS